MTLVSHALTTRQKVKDYLGISDTSKDTIIDQLINNATYFIESYCGGRRFKSANYVEIKDCKGQKRLFLNQYPVTALTTVEYRSGTPSSPTWVTYNADSYLSYLSEGYLQFYGKLPNVPQGMRVSYTAGYLIDFSNEFSATHTLPFDITQVCTEIVAKKVGLSTSQGISSQSTEGQSITYDVSAKDLTAEHKNILATYQAIRYAI